MLYINDLRKVLRSYKICKFADDTTLYSSAQNVDTVILNLNEDLLRVNQWLIKNSLCLNINKCQLLIIDKNALNTNISNQH